MDDGFRPRRDQDLKKRINTHKKLNDVTQKNSSKNLFSFFPTFLLLKKKLGNCLDILVGKSDEFYFNVINFLYCVWKSYKRSHFKRRYENSNVNFSSQQLNNFWRQKFKVFVRAPVPKKALFMRTCRIVSTLEILHSHFIFFCLDWHWVVLAMQLFFNQVAIAP